MKVLLPLQFLAPNGVMWLTLLYVEGLRFRLVLVCFYCPSHDGWHVFKGF